MNRVMVDSSVILGWLLDDSVNQGEDVAFVREVIHRGGDILAPGLMVMEVVNACYWRHHLTLEKIELIVQRLADLEINYINSEELDISDLVYLIEAYQLTAYDAAYLQAAIHDNCQLITHDKALLKADTKVCMTPEKFLEKYGL